MVTRTVPRQLVGALHINLMDLWAQEYVPWTVFMFIVGIAVHLDVNESSDPHNLSALA